MDIILILFIFVCVIFLAVFQVLMFMKLNKNGSEQSTGVLVKWLEQMQQRLDRNADVLERSMRATNESMAGRLDKTSEMLSMVGQRVGEMSEIGRSMKDLGDLLKSPKMRGNLGEFVLRDLLAQYLPQSSFELQYHFKNGYIADAIVRTEQGILCIDSKFPFESYRKMYESTTDRDQELYRREFVKDVRKHVDAISSKYIVPEERSFDYALMYIPSESVYYEVVCQQHELLDYAQQKQVIVVSPSIFYAYLRVILLSLQGKQVEERAKDLMKNFRGLEQEFRKFSDQFGVGMKHLNNARNAFDDAQVKFLNVEGKVQRLLQFDERETISHMASLQDTQEFLKD